MRFYLRIWILIACLFNHSVFSSDVSEKISTLIHEQLPHATVGIHVKNADSNAVVYHQNSDKLLVPASGMKLLPSAAALYQWKPNHQFKTTLSEKNQTIYLTFSGDPSLTTDKLKALLLNLKNNNKIF